MVEWKKLGEVCEFIRGKSLSKKDKGDGRFPIILYGELYTTYREYINTIVSHTSESIAKTATKIEKGDVLLPLSSTTKEAQIGKASVLNVDLNVRLGGDAIALRHKENAAYLMYYINSFHFEDEKMKCVKGTTIMHLSPKGIADITIPIPSLSEQQRIVETLDTFTASIDNLKEQIAQRRKQYEHYRDQLLDFSGNNVEWKPLVWAFPFIRNGFVGTVTPFFTDKDNGVRYLEGTNIHDGTISDNKELYVTYDFHRKHIKNELKADDILMVQSGHIGECAIVGEKYKGANCHALIIMSNGGKCNSKFIVYYFHTGKGFKSLSPAITGGAIKHVLAKKVGKIMIPIPSLSEQSRIVSILDSFKASIANLEEQLALRQKQYECYREKLLNFE